MESVTQLTGAFVADLEPIERLTKDLRNSAKLMTPKQARYLVDLYYQIQEYRMRAANQKRAAIQGAEEVEDREPHELVSWTHQQMEKLEGQIRTALDKYSNSQPEGEWARSILGVGPVIAAGLIGYIDGDSPCISSVWRFAGLDPTIRWEKGQKRPYNADLKVLCYKLGESFVKVQNNDQDIYGQIFRKRKDLETERNERGDNAALCEEILSKKKFNKSTEAYKHYSNGKLPPAQIHARARRFAVKRFLSHYFSVKHFIKHGFLPGKPWIFEHGETQHVHYHRIPNGDMIPGLVEAEEKIIADIKRKNGGQAA